MFDNHVNKIFHVTDDNDKKELIIKEVQSGVLDKKILKEEDDDVLVVDVGRKVFVWIGSTANKKEIRNAMKHAVDYLGKTKRPLWTPCERIFSGREPAHFWKAFGSKHYKE